MANELKDLLVEADIYATPYAVINDDAVYDKMAEYLVAKGVTVGDKVETSAVTDEKQIEEMANEIEALYHCEGYADNRGCYFANSCTSCKNGNRERAIQIAELLINIGYRKVEQGEWADVKKPYSTSLGGKGTSPYRMCTACKWEYPVVTVGQHLKKYTFCPNCGAKMKGE